MKDDRVLLVSAGMEHPKKSDNPVVRENRYLNYGLLGLGSLLARDGYDPLVVHGHFSFPEAFAQWLNERELLTLKTPLLLSMPSSLALGWAKRFCREAMSLNPALRIVAGGRWVVSDDSRWVSQQIPEVALVVHGTAEERISSLVDATRWPSVQGTSLTGHRWEDRSGFISSISDYAILHEYEHYHPSFEISRGCGMGCSFCAEADSGLSPLKKPSDLFREIGQCLAVYEERVKKFYFESSLFAPTSKWIDVFADRYRADGFDFQWRCETRVDSLSVGSIKKLASVGLRVVDLGLESANHKQLLRMKKTLDPERYLARASQIIQIYADNGVQTKINVLLYPGETSATLNETVDWLLKHREYIRGVSIGPLVVYRCGFQTDAYVQYLNALGAAIVSRDDLDNCGYTGLHLSTEIDADEAEELSREISRMFMDAAAFYSLKSFCYFSPQLTFDAFIELARSSLPDSLTFSIS